MKIRTDFVTNSSSSSFTVEVKIKLSNGKVLGWSNSANDEGGYYYSSITVLKSPAELAQASSIDELIDMLNQSIRSDFWDEDEPGEPIEVGDTMFRYVNVSMDDIKRIEITGNRRGADDYNRTFVYDRETKEYYGSIYGYDQEINGGSGGDLIFSDKENAKIHRQNDPHENMNYIQNGKLYINARDNYGDFPSLFLGKEKDCFEFDMELEEFDEIVIGDNVEYISPGILSEDGYTSDYQRIIVSEKNEHFCVLDGSLYSKDGKILYQVPPRNVTDGLHIKHGEIIESCAINTTKDLEHTTIFLDEGIKELRVQSIMVPGKLTVYIPKSICKIDDSAFDDYEELEIIAPENPYAQERFEEIKQAELDDQ